MTADGCLELSMHCQDGVPVVPCQQPLGNTGAIDITTDCLNLWCSRLLEDHLRAGIHSRHQACVSLTPDTGGLYVHPDQVHACQEQLLQEQIHGGRWAALPE
jgi:hypothetical protein